MTDKETVDIVQMVLAGKVNKTLVNLLEMKGGRAMGISGMDGRLIEAEIKDERLGYVGKITNVNITPHKTTCWKRDIFPWFPPSAATDRATALT